MTTPAQLPHTAHVIRSDADADAIAVEASLRDRERRLPIEEPDEFCLRFKT